MEEILNRLTEIEDEASAVLKNTENSKRLLSDDYDRKIHAFDEALEQETAAKIQEIRVNLVKEKDERLSSLRSNTERNINKLEMYYETHHTQLAKKLFSSLL